MKRKEIDKLNNLLLLEIKCYSKTKLIDVLNRIWGYKYVYNVLGIEQEYQKIINTSFISEEISNKIK